MWVPWFDFANHPSEAPSLRDDTKGRAGGAAPRAHGGSDHQRPPIQLDIRYDVERHALVLSTLAPAAAGEELHYLYHRIDCYRQRSGLRGLKCAVLPR